MSTTPSRARRRQATKEAVKAGSIAPDKRKLTPQELIELEEVVRIANAHTFVANQLKKNTALLPARRSFFRLGGKHEIVQEAEAIARIMDEVKRQWIANRLAACGYPPDEKWSINLTTGDIVYEP